MNETINTLYDWQQTTWQQIHQSRERLPHALLLHGQVGIGKLSFAYTLSQSLLCKSPTSDHHACGSCASCHWFSENSHPDFRELKPESADDSAETSSKKKTQKKQNITIAQVRDLTDFVNLTSHNEQGLRIILIQPVESLNTASANALLKMLEEPANNVIFILVSHQLQRVLPTILSRCHKVAMPPPTPAQSIAWLNTQGIDQAEAQLAYYANSPIQVVAQATHFETLESCWQLLAKGSQTLPTLLANKLISQSVESGIITLQKWLYDIASQQSTARVVEIYMVCVALLDFNA